MSKNRESGLTLRADDCELTRTIRAALYATKLRPSEDDVIGIVISIKEDFLLLSKDSPQFSELVAGLPQWVEYVDKIKQDAVSRQQFDVARTLVDLGNACRVVLKLAEDGKYEALNSNPKVEE